MVTGPSYLLLAALSVLFPFLFSFLCLPLFSKQKKKRIFFFWIWIVFVRVFMFGSLLETTTRFLPSFLVDIINEYSVVGTPFVGVQFLFYFQNKSQAVIVQRHIYIIYIEKNHWNAIVWSPSRPSPEIRETGFFWFCLWLSSYRGKARKPNSIIFLLYRILLLPSFFSFFPKLNGLYVRQQEMRAKAETKFDFGAFESSLNSTSQRHFASSVVVVFLSHHLFFFVSSPLIRGWRSIATISILCCCLDSSSPFLYILPVHGQEQSGDPHPSCTHKNTPAHDSHSHLSLSLLLIFILAIQFGCVLYYLGHSRNGQTRYQGL